MIDDVGEAEDEEDDVDGSAGIDAEGRPFLKRRKRACSFLTGRERTKSVAELGKQKRGDARVALLVPTYELPLVEVHRTASLGLLGKKLGDEI